MRYTFKDLYEEEVQFYDSAKVLFVLGHYNLFNNIAIDKIKMLCKPPKQEAINEELLKDFGIEGGTGGGTEVISVSNNVDFDTFTKVIDISSMEGKWFTSIDYAFASKKQRDWINAYIKSPSNNGRLVVYCNEFKNYRMLLKSSVIANSQWVHLIQLSFPSRKALINIVEGLFEKNGALLERKSIELFIMRMSNSYDDYEETVEKIINETIGTVEEGSKLKSISYDSVLQAMKGIENYVLDDFLERLLEPLELKQANGKRKIYRMLNALLEEFGAVSLVNKLRFKVDDYIEFRLAINSGIIPVKVRFSVQEAKSRLGEEHKLTRFSDYTFRKMALLASETSLKDWVYMKMMLAHIKYKYEPASYERALYSLINRKVLNASRLNNDIGIENIVDKSVSGLLDSVPYNEEHLIFNKNTETEGE